MSKEVARFVRFIAVLSVTMGTLVFIAGIIIKQGRDIVGTLVYGFVVVIVANVPQGLTGKLLI
jgi:sodium/potassium-transporting ATPase subunit alpha